MSNRECSRMGNSRIPIRFLNASFCSRLGEDVRLGQNSSVLKKSQLLTNVSFTGRSPAKVSFSSFLSFGLFPDRTTVEDEKMSLCPGASFRFIALI